MYNILDRVIKIISGLITFVVMSRIYSIEDFGYYAFAYSVATSVCVIANFGLDQLSPKIFAEKSCLSDVIYSRMMMSLPVLIVFFILILMGLGSLDGAFIVGLIAYVAFNYATIIFNYYNQNGELKVQLYLTLITASLMFPLKYFSVTTQQKNFLVYAIVLDVLIPFIFFVIIERKKFISCFILGSVRNFICKNKDAIMALTITSIIIQLNIRAESALLTLFMQHQSELGYYSMALRLNDLVAVLVSLIITSASPKIFSAPDRATTVKIAKKLALSVSGVCIIAVCVFYFVGDFIITEIFGISFAGVEILVVILIIGTLGGGISSIISMIVIKYEMSIARVKVVLVALISTVIWSVILIPTYGASGAAAANVASNIFSMIISVFLLSKIVKFR